MPIAKQLYVAGMILYTILASIISHATKINFIHIFNAFMLSSILYQILDWKYDEGENNDR